MWPQSAPKMMTSADTAGYTHERLSQLVEPNTGATLPHPLAAEVESVHPRTLLTPERFDLPAKYIYAAFCEPSDDPDAWYSRIYSGHINAFNGGVERSSGAHVKHSVHRFRQDFRKLLQTVEEDGFDPDRSLIPVSRENVLLDGAHRVIAALVADCPVHIARFDVPSPCYDYRRFRRRGMQTEWLDAMALAYCALAPHTTLVILRSAPPSRAPGTFTCSAPKSAPPGAADVNPPGTCPAPGSASLSGRQMKRCEAVIRKHARVAYAVPARSPEGSALIFVCRLPDTTVADELADRIAADLSVGANDVTIVTEPSEVMRVSRAVFGIDRFPGLETLHLKLDFKHETHNLDAGSSARLELTSVPPSLQDRLQPLVALFYCVYLRLRFYLYIDRLCFRVIKQWKRMRAGVRRP